MPSLSFKVIGYLLAAAALAGALWWVGNRIRVSYEAELERDAARAELKQEREQNAANLKVLADGAATNRQISLDLAAFRGEQAASSQSFRDELAKRNITREIRYETKDGTVTCTERDPERYRGLFNAAVNGGGANP